MFLKEVPHGLQGCNHLINIAYENDARAGLKQTECVMHLGSRQVEFSFYDK